MVLEKGITIMGDTRKGITAEYRANAVALVVEDGRTIAEVARGIGISPQTLGDWVKNARAANPPSQELSRPERDELEALRAENVELRMQLEFARKAAAWFARGQR